MNIDGIDLLIMGTLVGYALIAALIIMAGVALWRPFLRFLSHVKWLKDRIVSADGECET